MGCRIHFLNSQYYDGRSHTKHTHNQRCKSTPITQVSRAIKAHNSNIKKKDPLLSLSDTREGWMCMCGWWKWKESLIFFVRRLHPPRRPWGAQKGIKNKNVRKEAVSPGSTPSLLSPEIPVFLFSWMEVKTLRREREREREEKRCWGLREGGEGVVQMRDPVSRRWRFAMFNGGGLAEVPRYLTTWLLLCMIGK